MDLAKNLKIDSVSRLSPTPPLGVEPGQAVADAVALMRENKVGCVLVCRDGRLVGIFTERDVLRLAGEGARFEDLQVREVMTPRPITISPDDDVLAAAELLGERRIRHLPVCDDRGLCGIVSIGDLVKARIDQLEEERAQLVDYIQTG